jgi:fumarate hydratase subunit alpha/L(+)-tartrate dehydratase alpha subunit
VDGVALTAAIRRGCERATREGPLRSSIVHPLTRKNDHTSCGISVPVIHVAFSGAFDGLRIEMIPKGSGSENNSWLKMAIPAEGVDAIRTFVIDCVLGAAGGPARRRSSASASAAPRPVRPSAKIAATRPLGSHCADPEAPRWSASCRRPSTCSASVRRASAAMPPRSPCTSRSRRRTSR